MKDFDHKQIDEIIHSRIRLAIMAILLNVEHAEFIFLKKQINTTDGNLSIHLKKLEDAGYIAVEKHFVDRKPVSSYKITDRGREAFQQYVQRLDNFIRR
ncbi:transcriptional regulator [candidate division KSB1 bacterium 4484_87]|nr:MAG: transcriptional regulator [candidate division KSB1 bacterium 4484_87]